MLLGEVTIAAIAAFLFYDLVGPTLNSALGTAVPLVAWGALGGGVFLVSGVSLTVWMSHALEEPTQVRVSNDGVDFVSGLLSSDRPPRHIDWSWFGPECRAGRPGFVIIWFAEPAQPSRTRRLLLSEAQFRALLSHPSHPESWTDQELPGLSHDSAPPLP
jgi:hypothetical protein